MKKYLLIALLALVTLVSADYFNISDSPLYCQRYDIENWCSHADFTILEDMVTDGLHRGEFINEYAFDDKFRYGGNVFIKDIDARAEYQDGFKVSAEYTLKNSGDSAESVELSLMGEPSGTIVTIDGELYTDYTSKVLDFGPMEERNVSIAFTEPKYGNIFAYNVNLLFDKKATDNSLTDSGTYTFVLPKGAIVECAPAGYSVEKDGPTTVSWERTDFVPWTNPFNDLICTWDIGEANATETASEEAAPEGDSSIWLIIILLIILPFAYLWRTGRIGKPSHD